MYTRKTLYFRAFMALKHGQMHTILILLTIKQSNIIDFYGLFTATKIFLLHLLFYYYISACSPSEHSRNILHIVTLALDHRLIKHSKFIKHFTTPVVTTLFTTGNIFYKYNTSDISPSDTSAIFFMVLFYHYSSDTVSPISKTFHLILVILLHNRFTTIW